MGVRAGFFTTFRGGVHFPSEGSGWVSIAGFRPQGGVGCKIFGREAPENGAEGAVLENFGVFGLKCELLS